MNQFEHSSRGYATQTKNTQLASLVHCPKSSFMLVWASCTVAHLVQYSEASQKLTDQLTHQYSLSLCKNNLQTCFASLMSRRICFILIFHEKHFVTVVPYIKHCIRIKQTSMFSIGNVHHTENNFYSN